MEIVKMESKKGFTLVEIIVVLVILAILAAVTIPSYLGFIEDADEAKGRAEARLVLIAAKVAAIDTIKFSEGMNHVVYETNKNFKDKVDYLVSKDIDMTKVKAIGVLYPKGESIIYAVIYQYREAKNSNDKRNIIYYCETEGRSIMTLVESEYTKFLLNSMGQ